MAEEVDFKDMLGFAQNKTRFAEDLGSDIRSFVLLGEGRRSFPFALRAATLLREGEQFVPFRAPHKDTTLEAGRNEVELARGGVLYLDEPSIFSEVTLHSMLNHWASIPEEKGRPVLIAHFTEERLDAFEDYCGLFLTRGVLCGIIRLTQGEKVETQDSAYLRSIIRGEVRHWRFGTLALIRELQALADSRNGQYAVPEIRKCLSNFQRDYIG